MQLQDFIINVISDITTAIKKCKELDNGSIIVPTNQRAKNSILINNENREISYIDFDVAVTINNQTNNTTNKGAGITVLSAISIGANQKEKMESINETVSRIKFSIPLAYPSTSIEEHVPIKKI